MADARQRIGSYDILLELASGGVGTVDVALQRGAAGFERFVVVKRVHRFLLKNKDSYAMFRDEARLASSIRHPNVVPVIDVVEGEGELLLVMEYVEGVSLSTLRKAYSATDTPMPVSIATRIMSDVLAGLHGAHEATDLRGNKLEIVHRDVSPQNVLVGVDGVARVIDFGIAKAAGRLTETQSGYVKGKFAYMSPEQIESVELDRRSDVFSAGVVLHEALTGRRLFQAESDMATLRKVVKGEVPDPSTLVSGVPPAVDAVLKAALSRDREQRFMTARAFQVALETAAPPAPAREVADAVRAICASELEERRLALVAALGADAPRLTATLPPVTSLEKTLREPTSAEGAPSSVVAAQPPEPVAPEPPSQARARPPSEGDTRVAATADVARALRPRSYVWLAAPAAAGVLGAALVVAWPRGPKVDALSPPVTATRTTPAPDPLDPPPSAPSSAAPSSASSSASPSTPATPSAPSVAAVAAPLVPAAKTARPPAPRVFPSGTTKPSRLDDLRHDFDAGRPF